MEGIKAVEVVGDYLLFARAEACGEGRYTACVEVAKASAPDWRLFDWHATAVAFESPVAAIAAGLASGRRWLIREGLSEQA